MTKKQHPLLAVTDHSKYQASQLRWFRFLGSRCLYQNRARDDNLSKPQLQSQTKRQLPITAVSLCGKLL